MVVAVQRVFAGFVDHDRDVGVAYFVAQGGGQVQLATHGQAKVQLVAHSAGGP